MNNLNDEGKEHEKMTKKEKQEKKMRLEEKVKAMLNAGYYTGEIAKALNITEGRVIQIRGERK